MRGRKPTATVLKLARGNPGKRALNKDEPRPDALATACPEEITDPVAQKEWARVIVPAIARGQITADDRVLAIAHCHYWARYLSLTIEASRHAHIIAAGKNKYPMANPAEVRVDKVLALLAKVDAELGFSPTSRTRVKTPGAPAANSLKERYFGGNRRA